MSAIHYLGDDTMEVEAMTFASFYRLITGSEIRFYFSTANNTKVIEQKMKGSLS
jgi:hypothetical protein